MLLEVAFGLIFVAMVGLNLSVWVVQTRASRTRKIDTRASTTRRAAAPIYVPFSEAVAADAAVCDCTHPEAPTFTHHKGHRNHKDIKPADTSTGLVINAIASGKPFSGWLDKPAVTVNHFDGDALFSCWSYINRTAALKHADILRVAAALHDFREMPAPEGQNADPLALPALALCCWVNSIERAQFSPPYEDKDADDKFAFFLRELHSFLEAPEEYKQLWIEEYDRVLADYNLITEQGRVQIYPDIGVAVIECPRPVHYYALFSHSLGCDVVVSMYEGQRYEVEEKYTQFVNVHSRKVQARLDMGPLSAVLNEADVGRKKGTTWGAPRMVDTGPLLRLDNSNGKLPKAQRYGHPTARPMYASGLSPEQFEGIVVSFFKHGLKGVPPKVGGWGWDELHNLNDKINWKVWAGETKKIKV